MSHALLLVLSSLRLFLSPYFSISVAMHYLKTYPESIGISHYLCWRMKSMPAEEVEFYWPQICHLLLTYPSPSNALESFIISRAEESTHSAMLTLWLMQAALRDLTPTRKTNPRPFHICQRVLHRCHEIIFGDPPEPSRSPYRSLPQSPPSSSAALLASTSMQILRNSMDPTTSGDRVISPPARIKAHARPALVGMSMMMAGAPAMPALTDLVGQWAVSQGRKARDDGKDARARVELDKSGGADGLVDRTKVSTPKISEDSVESDEEDRTVSLNDRKSISNPVPPPNQSMLNLPHPSSTAPNLSSPPLLSSPHFSPHLQGSPSPNGSPMQKGEDPFSQYTNSPGPSRTNTPPFTKTPPISSQSASYSVPELKSPQQYSSSSRRYHPIDRLPPPEALLATYSSDAQRQLLRGHYCRSEIRFLLILEDISNRLLVIPKPARVSALRAELTSLNHNLPAEICIPMWCGADHSHEEGGEAPAGTPLKSRPQANRKRAHSRIVRISPSDSVVLNSAERAPFLLHVEILEGDLDFDPARRDNKELLKKIVVQEDVKRKKKEGVLETPRPVRSEGFGAPMPDVVPPRPNGVRRQTTRSTQSPTVDSGPISPPGPSSQPKANPAEVEEMDLVEQLYGAKLSVRDAPNDIDDSVPLRTAPRNKALDVAAWDRGAESSSRRTSFTVNSPTPFVPDSPQPSTTVSDGTLDVPARSDSPVHGSSSPKRTISLEDYSERMRTAAVMLAQLNASLVPQATAEAQPSGGGGVMSWIPGTGWIMKSSSPHQSSLHGVPEPPITAAGGKLKLAAAQAAAIKERIMEEMMALEEERVDRLTERSEGVEMEATMKENGQTAEDEGIVRRELNKADPSAAVFKESWIAKKTRIRASSPWGHLANWNVISVIVKTGTDLRQEQLATQLIERFSRIFKEEKCDCWVRYFRILITGEQSGLVETITDAVSIHSIKKGEYARRIAEGGPIGHVSVMDHFVNTYGPADSGRFARAQRNFIKSLAGYSIVTYLLQIKDRHNGNILLDRDGHLIHIDFGFMLSNSPGGNMGFEAAPFKLPMEYVDIMGGLDSPGYAYFKKLFKEGFEAARKHSDSLITIVELMQKDSKLDCFALFGAQTTNHFRERFALGLTTGAVDTYLERLIVTSTGSNYTRLYDTFQYYSQGVL